MSADVTYPAVVKLPTFVGVSHEQHNVSAFNIKTGEIVHDKVIVTHPDMKYKVGVRIVFNFLFLRFKT